MALVNVVFVCLGNICRSPAAAGLFRALVNGHGLDERFGVDSAGTSDWNLGRPPDRRSVAEALRRGIDLSEMRARQVCLDDFQQFDLVLAMDRRNVRDLLRICPKTATDRVRLLLDFAPEAAVREVPDPYLGGAEAFRAMFDLVDLGARGVLKSLLQGEVVSLPKLTLPADGKD